MADVVATLPESYTADAPQKEKIRDILARAVARQPILAFFAIALIVGEALLGAEIVRGHYSTLIVSGALGLMFVAVGAVVYLARHDGLDFVEHSGDVGRQRPVVRGEIASPEAIVEVTAEIDNGTLRDPKVSALSSTGKMFFGFRGDFPVDRLIGRTSQSMTDELKKYIDPPISFWNDLGKDQQRVYEQFMAGKPAYARVPVRFNDEHPHFKRRSFLPVIVERRTDDDEGRARDVTRVLYFDTTAIPVQIFRDAAWRSLGKDLDLSRLADEFASIRQSWTNANDAAQRRYEIDVLARAETRLREGGGPEVIGLCSEAGWFSLWDISRVLHLGVTKVFVEKVLGKLD
jgi:hypothetical protein